VTSSASAAPHQDNRRPTTHRGSWARGHRLSPSDRHRAVPIDYRHHGLRAPHHGYRWVRINGRAI
jgi:Ni/Co efflux regulator RcnB